MNSDLVDMGRIYGDLGEYIDDLNRNNHLSQSQALEKMTVIQEYLDQRKNEDMYRLESHFLSRLGVESGGKRDGESDKNSDFIKDIFKKRILETPQSVSNAIWVSLQEKYLRLHKDKNKNIQDKDNKYFQLMRQIYLEDMFHSPPPNVSREFWNSLDKTKPELKIILWEEELDRKHHTAGIWKLFGLYNYHGDYDSAVSAMALMDALLLTITFTVAQSLNAGFQENLETVIRACPDKVAFGGKTYNSIFENAQRALSAAFYSNVGALILATGYFVFKPSHEEKLPLRRMRRQGAMVFVLFGCSFASVVATSCLAATVLNYYTVTNSRICYYDARYLYQPGVAVTILIFLFTLFMSAR